MSIQTDNKQVTRQLLAVFDHGRLEEIDQLAHPEFVNHEAPAGSPQGPEGLKQTINWLRGLWGPMRTRIEDEITKDDKVVARITMHDHHVGEFLGKPPPARNTPPSRSTSGASKKAKRPGDKRPRPRLSARARYGDRRVPTRRR